MLHALYCDLEMCEVICHCGSVCISLTISDIGAPFHVPLGYWMSSLEECLLWYFAHCIIWCFTVTLYESLHSVDISPLLDMWFANIFSHSMGCLA